MFFKNQNMICIPTLTRSASVLRQEGDRFDSRFHFCYIKYNINSMSRGNALAPNRSNSLPYTGRTSRKIKGLVVVCFVVWLGSMKGMGFITRSENLFIRQCFGAFHDLKRRKNKSNLTIQIFCYILFWSNA